MFKFRRQGVRSMSILYAIFMALAVAQSSVALAQVTESSAPASTGLPSDTFLLTVVLHPDQSHTISQITDQLTKQGFYKAFPPQGIEVVSWYAMMGYGLVITLRVPASRLREVNRSIETTAWGGFRSEFFATYDFKSIGLKAHEDALNK